jgi:hypothetical protein
MYKDKEDKDLAAQWSELNMGIDQWKSKFLYPFSEMDEKTGDLKAKITPITNRDEFDRMFEESI